MTKKRKIKICSFPKAVHVDEHPRKPHYVKGRRRKDGSKGPGFWRSGSIVSEHCRSYPHTT